MNIVSAENKQNYDNWKKRKISHADEEDWERKMRVYRQVMGDSHALHMVLVTTRGIVPNKYKNCVQNIVTLEDLMKE